MFFLETIKNYTIKRKTKVNYVQYYKFNLELFANYRTVLKNHLDTNLKIVQLIKTFDSDFTNLLLDSFGIDYKDYTSVGMIRYIGKKFLMVNYKDEDMGNIRLSNLLQNQVGELYIEIVKLNYCEREIFLRNYYYSVIDLFKVYLKENGNVFFSFFNDCVNTYTLEIYFILSTLFEKVIIINTRYLYCFNYLNQSALSEDKFTINDSIQFDGKPLIEKEIITFCTKYQEEFEAGIRLFLNKDYDKYIDHYILMNSELILNFMDNQKYLELQIKTVKRLFVNNKTIVRISSNINIKEGNLIKQLIKKYNCKNCLEIGMAFGISSNFILSASKNTRLVSIDPYQSHQWDNYGLKILRHNKLVNRHQLIQKKSHEALPELLRRHENSFDFIFVDGFHTFDYTLLDVFYSIRLLKINGVIVIDDVLHEGVSKVIRYIDTNYSFFLKKMLTKDVHTMCVYVKQKEDHRKWNFHKNF